MSESPKPGRLMKVLYVDDEGHRVGESSHQIPQDPFKTYSHGLQEPPFPLEQLVYLSESHPTHAAALEQKSADVIGGGWEWRTKKEDANEAPKEALEEWLVNLDDDTTDATVHEILVAAWDDYETLGHATIEIARDPSGKVRHLYHMPAHTVRFARDGVRVAQMRGEKRVWFKRWLPNDKREVDRVTGGIETKAKEGRKANEVLVLRKPTRRSSWYGIPRYVPSIGWIMLSLAGRDDNIAWFHNRREPRWAVILTNLEDDPQLEEDLHQAFKVDLKQPHRNLIIPIAGQGEIKFEKLSDTTTDMSFEKLQERSDAFILLGHKMPSERIGLSKVGPLGGSITIDASRVYKEGVVQPAQAFLAARINRFIEHESEIEMGDYLWHPKELDLTEEAQDLEAATLAFTSSIITLDEARRKLKYDDLDDEKMGAKFYHELVPPGGGQQDPLAQQTLRNMDKEIRKLVTNGQRG